MFTYIRIFSPIHLHMPCHVYATTLYMHTALGAFAASIKVLQWESKSFGYFIQIYVIIECQKVAANV